MAVFIEVITCDYPTTVWKNYIEYIYNNYEDDIINDVRSIEYILKNDLKSQGAKFTNDWEIRTNTIAFDSEEDKVAFLLRWG